MLMVHLYKFETYVSFNWAQNNQNKIYNNLRKLENYSVNILKSFYIDQKKQFNKSKF